MVEHWATKYKIAGSNPRLAPIRPKLNGNLPDNLPDWASPGNWLSLEGHADLKSPVDDPLLCNLCSFPLKLFKVEAEIMSSLNEFHSLTILTEKKCCLRSVITRFLCNFRECPLVLSL